MRAVRSSNVNGRPDRVGRQGLVRLGMISTKRVKLADPLALAALARGFGAALSFRSGLLAGLTDGAAG